MNRSGELLVRLLRRKLDPGCVVFGEGLNGGVVCVAGPFKSGAKVIFLFAPSGTDGSPPPSETGEIPTPFIVGEDLVGGNGLLENGLSVTSQGVMSGGRTVLSKDGCRSYPNVIKFCQRSSSNCPSENTVEKVSSKTQ